MALYRKQIEQITWEDVETFCQQGIAEGAYLDYKADFPDKLYNTIAAMANTFGGIVIIGVGEDKDNKPSIPLTGIDFKKGLSERVMNIILTNIAPPVFPEIQVCSDTSGGKALVLIRISQSHQGPHAVAKNTKVYLRTGNRNNPEVLADINKILWLVDHRKKSEELRERLLAKADERFKVLLPPKFHFADVSKGLFTLAISPLYPQKMFMDPPELRIIHPKIEVRNYTEHGNSFPLPNSLTSQIVQDGIVLNRVEGTLPIASIFHAELNCFGLYLFKCVLLRKPKVGSEEIIMIRSRDIFCYLDEFLDSSLKYYQQLGYWGALMFNMHLENIGGCALHSPFGSMSEYTNRFYYSPDSEVEFSYILQAANLEDEKSDLILKAAQRIAWSFDWDLKAETLSNFYKDLKQQQ